MARYDVGDVVLAIYPWEESDGSIKWKTRPAVVYSLEGDQERLIIKITTTDRSNKFPGIFVPMKSKEGKEMGLLQDSFIHVSDNIEVNIRDIRRKIGNCPYMDDIDEIINRAE